MFWSLMWPSSWRYITDGFIEILPKFVNWCTDVNRCTDVKYKLLKIHDLKY